MQARNSLKSGRSKHKAQAFLLAVVRICTIALGLAYFPATFSQSQFDIDSNAIDAVFSHWTENTPGGVVGIFEDGQQIYANAFGLADLEIRKPITLDTQFNIASISKTFTAFAILLLEEQGRLALDDDIRTYLPELPDFGYSISIADLLHHFSGIRNYSTLFAMQGTSSERLEHKQVLDVLKSQQELNHRPGDRETYSNSNYYLLALIVEKVTGQTFREFTHKEIFDPLGMNSTYFRDNLDEDMGNLAWGHFSPDGETYFRDMPTNNVYGSSNLITTMNDFARWERNLASPVIGSTELVNSLYTRGILRSGAASRFAKGTGYNQAQGINIRGMGGTTLGYVSSHTQHPGLGLTIVILTNSASEVYTPYSKIMQLCCEDAIARGLSDLANYGEKFVSMSDEQLGMYSGAYRDQRSNDVLLVNVNSESLLVTGFEFPIRVRPIGESEFASESPIDLTRLSFNSTGPDITLEIFREEELVFSASRLAEVEVSPEYLAQFVGVYRSPELQSEFQLSLKDGELYRGGEGFPDRLLTAQYADLFIAAGNTGTHLFQRDGEGNVSGFRISVAGVNNLLYEKLQ
ncbi:MAG: beta-lactamase family protein [Pseudomonadales bacterium]|nr:beta-lactamase family protein [Pseudomonadales bacterium]